MGKRKEFGVLVTGHAANRLRERFPEVTSDPFAFIYREVQAALHSGRRAKTRPRWVNDSHRSKGGSAGTVRYAWTREHDRCYVIARRSRGDRRDEFKETWRVVTVLRPFTRGATA